MKCTDCQTEIVAGYKKDGKTYCSKCIQFTFLEHTLRTQCPQCGENENFVGKVCMACVDRMIDADIEYAHENR